MVRAPQLAANQEHSGAGVEPRGGLDLRAASVPDVVRHDTVRSERSPEAWVGCSERATLRPAESRRATAGPDAEAGIQQNDAWVIQRACYITWKPSRRSAMISRSACHPWQPEPLARVAQGHCSYTTWWDTIRPRHVVVFPFPPETTTFHFSALSNQGVYVAKVKCH